MQGIAKYGPPALTFLPLEHQGKTRDTFLGAWPKGEDRQRRPRLIVATDRISTHDVVHKSTVGLKGQVLTALTVFWFLKILGPAGVRHHMLSFGQDIYRYLPGKRSDYPINLRFRSIMAESLDITLVEFIYRAYMAGSLWDKFYSRGLPNPYKLLLPAGIPFMRAFKDVLGSSEGFVFTPTVKSETDPPLPSLETFNKHPKQATLGSEVFVLGREYLNSTGIELVDSKFEVGKDENGSWVVGDEVLTPDSSRFVSLDQIKEGVEPPWRDKQLARDEAIRKWAGGKKMPLEFDIETIKSLSNTYLEVFEQITGKTLATFQKEYMK